MVQKIELNCLLFGRNWTKGSVNRFVSYKPNRSEPKSISTHEQLADFLTKALAPPKFNIFISKLGINIYHGPPYERVLKHNTEEIEANLLDNKEEEEHDTL